MTDITDTSAILVKALIYASEDYADDCSSDAETHAAAAFWHVQAFTEMGAHHQRTAATLRALLAERDENEKAIAVWRGRTQRAEAERDRLSEVQAAILEALKETGHE